MSSIVTDSEEATGEKSDFATGINEEDDQDQKDEIDALSSIFPDTIKIEHGRILPTFSLAITVETADVNYKCAFYNYGEKMPIGTCNLTYLTPILLRVSFPTTYPSVVSPLFSLQIEWLSYFQIKKLCTALDEMWTRNGPGAPIVYDWIDFLKNDTIKFLNIEEEFSIGVRGGEKDSAEDLRAKRLARFSKSSKDNGVDNRAISGWRPAFQLRKGEASDIENLMATLMRYDMIMKKKTFLAKAHTCMICWNEKEGKSFTTLACDHSFCTECMEEHAALNIKEGTVDKIVCPDPRCKQPLAPFLIKSLLGDEQYERWERILLQKTLDCMKDVVYCPRKNCNTPVIEESDNLGQCVKCKYAFCTLCFQSWHPGTVCMTAEDKLRALEMRGNRSNMNEFRKKLESLKEQSKTALAMQRMGCKQCPACGCTISKIEGCNKMRCFCGIAFCFVCGESGIDYSHFGDGKCELFSMHEIRRWENQMLNVGVDRYQEEVWRLQARGVNLNEVQQWISCCFCGQRVIKEGKNNHLTCWSCTRHFCFECRKPVRKASQHYGKGKCRQHS